MPDPEFVINGQPDAAASRAGGREPQGSAGKSLLNVENSPQAFTLNQQKSEIWSEAYQPLDNVLRVNTPENVAFEYQLAGPFRRGLAYLLDVCLSVFGYVALATLFFLTMIFAIVPLATQYGLGDLADAFLRTMVGMTLVLYFIVYWFYGAFMETMFNGQTIGKRMTGMRVLTVDGHSIDAVQATLRNFFRLLDVSPFVPIGALLAFDSAESQAVGEAIKLPTCFFALVVMGCNRRFQRIGDWVAGTVVVNQSQMSAPQLITFEDPRVVSLSELIPPQFVPTNNLVKAIANYADRRRSLHPQRAREIAAHVARPLLEQFHLMPDTDYDLFLCALYYRIFKSSPGEDGVTGSEMPSWIPAGGRSFDEGR